MEPFAKPLQVLAVGWSRYAICRLALRSGPLGAGTVVSLDAPGRLDFCGNVLGGLLGRELLPVVEAAREVGAAIN